jgi:hypothetical protein
LITEQGKSPKEAAALTGVCEATCYAMLAYYRKEHPELFPKIAKRHRDYLQSSVGKIQIPPIIDKGELCPNTPQIAINPRRLRLVAGPIAVTELTTVIKTLQASLELLQVKEVNVMLGIPVKKK